MPALWQSTCPQRPAIPKKEVNSMKKLIFLVVIILLLAGCSKTIDIETAAPDVPNPNGYMTEPLIFVSSGHQYKQEGWSEESVEIIENNIELQGTSFSINIIFEGSIAEDKFKEAVMVEGFEEEAAISIIPSEGKTVFYGNYTGITANKPYKLMISKDIADSEGKTLKNDIQKEIMLSPDTTALYTFASSEGSFGGLGWQNVADAFAVGNMNWSPDPKTIIVDFSAEVDAASVEQSIRESFSDKNIKFNFDWNNTKKLTLKLENFKGGDPEPYMISMVHAKDLEGNPVYGNLFFTTSKHNYLGSIDMMDRKDSVVYKFPDRRFMTVQSHKINDNIILDDTEAKYVFNITGKTSSKIDINRDYILGIPDLSFKHSWLDSSTIIMVARTDGTIVSYSTIDGSSTELFALPIEIVKSNIIDISASPDGSKLVVIHETMNPETYGWNKYGFHISVFDMSGNHLQRFDDVFKPRFMEIFGAVSDIQWLDNETLILEDNISSENQLDYNIISVNIKTGKKTLIAEHAFKPVVLTGKDIIKLESSKDFNTGEGSIEILKNGKKAVGFQKEAYQYNNFFFADENTLIYNENDKILAYDIDKGKSEVLGNGYIIGVTENGSKVYYMTNHRMLYYID
ncbi:MAG: hypothetical protein K0Q65_733 [Clostridia bacterium]|jgi:hypothetical protein|nr:hypothetical protein [Clostridia bacterium]